MSTVNPTTSDGPFDSSHTPHHRRSREEVEALAKNFVAAPVEAAAPPAKPMLKIAMAAGGVALLAVVALVAWPKREEAARPAQSEEASRIAAEAEQWKQRFEAEKERRRQELASSKDYLERIAAADAALVNEMTARAQNLASRAEAAQEPSKSDDAAPTPRAEPARAAKPAAATSQPAAATTTKDSADTPPKAAAAPASEPAQVATAAPAAEQGASKASCKIHVSELSASGKLTYDDVTRMSGVRIVKSNGHVFTPPVKTPSGTMVVFEVMPDGCVKVARR